MNIQLKKLELTNYRNIEHATYEFNGNSKIVGDNRIGKTNTLESIHYLLTGYLLNGSSDIQSIKPLANPRAVVSVEGTFDIDGKTITIAKKYGEEWVKQRNTGEEIMKGHFSELYYNGVKQPTLRDYNSLFYDDFGINQNELLKINFAQLLTNPYYIGDMSESEDWKEVRKFIVELVGDVKDEDVFAKEPMTEILRQDLTLANGRIDQLKKKLDGEIKGLKETLIADDAKVEMLEKATAPTDDEIAGARANLNRIDEEIASLRSNTGNKELEVSIKNKIADLNVKLAESKAKTSQNGNNDKLIELGNKRNDAFDDKNKLQSKISELNYKIENQDSKVSRLEIEKSNLLVEYRELKNAKPEVETICPTCKRPLDPSQIEKARQDFLDANKTKMEIIVLEGKKKSQEISDAKALIEQCQKDKDALEPQLDTINAKIQALNDEIAKARAVQSVPTESEETKALELEKAKLEKELVDAQTSSEKARTEISTRIYELELSKAPHQKVIDDYAYATRMAREKENCETEREKHSKELVRREQMKDMIQKFIFTKLQMLDSNVARVFGNIKFQLIKENINGGFDTVCKPYIYDPIKKASSNVLWKSGSKSERVATGIAIAEAIKKSLHLADLPYLFDEGGEISDDTMKTRLQTNSQIICVKVQDNISTPLVLSL